jgi:hypothetical protein
VPADVYESFVETLNGQFGAAKFSCTFKVLLVVSLLAFPFSFVAAEVMWQLFFVGLFTHYYWLSALTVLGGFALLAAWGALLFSMHHSIINVRRCDPVLPGLLVVVCARLLSISLWCLSRVCAVGCVYCLS